LNEEDFLYWECLFQRRNQVDYLLALSPGMGHITTLTPATSWILELVRQSLGHENNWTVPCMYLCLFRDYDIEDWTFECCLLLNGRDMVLSAMRAQFRKSNSLDGIARDNVNKLALVTLHIKRST